MKAWSAELDFIQRAPRAARGSWLALFGAVVFLLHALDAQDRRQSRIEALGTRHDNLGREWQRLAATASSTPPRPSASTGQESALMAALEMQRLEAGYAWPRLLVAVERASASAAADGQPAVALTSMSHRIDGQARAALSVEGLCRQPADALVFADALAADPAFADAFVAFHATLLTPEGPWQQQFRVDAYPAASLSGAAPSPARGGTESAS